MENKNNKDKKNLKNVADVIGTIAGLTEAFVTGSIVGTVGGAVVNSLPGGKYVKMAGYGVFFVGGMCTSVSLAPWFVDINQAGARRFFHVNDEDSNILADFLIFNALINRNKGK